MENQTEIIKTADTRTASYLICVNIPLIKIIRNNPQRIVFCFPQNEEVKRLLQLYWTNKAQCNPRLLFEKYDYVLDLVHQDYDI